MLQLEQCYEQRLAFTSYAFYINKYNNKWLDL